MKPAPAFALVLLLAGMGWGQTRIEGTRTEGTTFGNVPISELDTLALTDSAAASKTSGAQLYPRTDSDSAAIADSIATDTPRISRSLSDSFALVDSIAATKRYVRGIASRFDDSHFSDSAGVSVHSGGTQYQISLGETLAFTDPAHLLSAIQMIDSDTLALGSETITRHAIHSATLSEGINASDALIGGLNSNAYSRSASDSLHLAETFAANGLHTAAIGEGVSVADSIAQSSSHTYPAAPGETVTADDSLTAFALHLPALTDGLDLPDSVSAVAFTHHGSYEQELGDGASVGDSIAVTVRSNAGKKRVMVIS